MKCSSYVEREASFSGGSYSYMGFQYALESSLHECDLTNAFVNNLSLYFNVDGLPICKSNNLQFWPILVKPSLLGRPSAVAVFKGPSKPDMFFNDFVQDASTLIEKGLCMVRRFLM